MKGKPIQSLPVLPPILIDTREQAPFTFDHPTQAATLPTGDYSLRGLAEYVAIERKSLPDLCACIGRDRDRFKRELHRLQAYQCAAVVIEADMGAIVAGEYRSRVHPAAIVGSLSKWLVRYRVPFLFAGTHGATVTLAILRNYHNHPAEMLGAVTAEGSLTASSLG